MLDKRALALPRQLIRRYRTRDPFRGYYWARRPWRKDAPEATWDDRLMTRQRVESEAFEKPQLDYSTGLPMNGATRVKEK